jgi:hypothetical protein
LQSEDPPEHRSLLGCLRHPGLGLRAGSGNGAPEDPTGPSPAPTAEETALRFAKEELGWERIRLLDSLVADTPGAENAGPVQLRVIRCAESDWDDSYPDISCDPSPADHAYPAAVVTVEGGAGNESAWIVTDLERVSVQQLQPGSARDVRRFVEAFLESRVKGSGAERYLTSNSRPPSRSL